MRGFGFFRATPGGGTITPALDGYDTTPTHAYGLAQLLASYSGALVRVRRSSDDTEQDFGFAAGTKHLDAAALLAFVGGGSGYVTKWYNQGSAGSSVDQGTVSAQPRIVNAGVVDLIQSGGQPAIAFDGATYLDFGANVFGDMTAAVVASRSNAATPGSYLETAMAGQGGGGGGILYLLGNGYVSEELRANPLVSFGGATSYGIWRDGARDPSSGEMASDALPVNTGAALASKATGVGAAGSFTVGAAGGSYGLHGAIQTVAIFPTVLTDAQVASLTAALYGQITA